MNILGFENIEWIFSGCGVAIVSAIFLYVKDRKKKHLKEASRDRVIIKSGGQSNNVISKGDVNINVSGKE